MTPFGKTLDKRWKNYRSAYKRCKRELSNPAVHDLRVATRRMRASLRLLQAIAPHRYLKKSNRALKRQMAALNDLRDTQVMLAEIARIPPELPMLQALQTHLQTRERRLSKRLHDKLPRADLARIAKWLRKARKSLKKMADVDLGARLLQAVDASFHTVRRRYDRIDATQPASLHRMRIAFKNFRYTLEIAHAYLYDFPLEQLDRMRDYQTLLGEIQDADVFLRTVDAFSAPTARQEAASLRHDCTQRRSDAIAAYLAHKGRVTGFWRAAPDQPFPWEQPT